MFDIIQLLSDRATTGNCETAPPGNCLRQVLVFTTDGLKLVF